MPSPDLLARHTEGLQVRDFHTRAEIADGGRTITAIGVPYDTEIHLFGEYREKFAPGSVEDDGAILRFNHKHPIGLIPTTEDTAEGRAITGIISKTPTGDEVRTLVEDGVLSRMSIGFEGISHEVTEREDGTVLITWTKVRAREYSIVEFPAYEAAEILDLRSIPTERKNPMPTTPAPVVDTETADAIVDLRRSVEDLQRSMIALTDAQNPTTPTVENRSAGELLIAARGGDETALAALNQVQARSWDGTKLDADALAEQPTFIKDLMRLIDKANPLATHFASDSLPSTGKMLEFVRIKTNEIKVAKQENEGDDLVTGKLDTEDASEKIHTYGGYTSLSFQAIERSPAHILDKHLRAMAIAAGAVLADDFSDFFEKAVKGQAERALTFDKALAELGWADLNALIIDAAAAYSDQAISMDGLIVDKATFKALTGKEDKSGRPLFKVYGEGVNAVGMVSHEQDGLRADLAGLKLIPNFRAKTNAMGEHTLGAFFNRDALCSYTSPLARLQDANVVNLTQAFSVYRYAAFADELPHGLVPVKVAG